MVNIFKPDYSLDLAAKMSKAQYCYEMANRLDTDQQEVRQRTMNAMKESIKGLKVFAKQQEAPLFRFGRKVLKFFGVVTRYQKVVTQIEALERSAKLLEAGGSEQLLNLISRKEVDKAKINKAANDLNKELNEQIHEISQLKEKSLSISGLGEELEAIPVAKIAGGIRNGGNTCYIASALQIMNHIEEYRNLFDPELNPLEKSENETEDSHKQRVEIQRRGREILDQIKDGVTVSKSDINAFRKACYAHKIDGETQVVTSLWREGEALSVMTNLFRVLGYNEPSFSMDIQHIFKDPEAYEELEPNLDPKDYRTAQYTEPTALILNAAAYRNGTIKMQDLINDFYVDDQFDNLDIKYIAEDGQDICYRKYYNVIQQKTLKLEETSYPKVLRITVKQFPYQKVGISEPHLIYPSGDSDKGPRYKLAGIIEHKPGHYVAELVTPEGEMLKANDSRVSAIPSDTAIPGVEYFYLLDEKQ